MTPYTEFYAFQGRCTGDFRPSCTISDDLTECESIIRRAARACVADLDAGKCVIMRGTGLVALVASDGSGRGGPIDRFLIPLIR
ncbi:hypothetical protein Y032_0032g2594 [Ancylostoma ceylanicum]|uniref:Uncharacterized protein n=1 Tax=Ancylostoma ceylanicum TaxID=53326 RepID=A0A016UQ25_9BILA|nr:hypothetical protein Y032_0032g2594 [Ancylostoma ceylanicum]